MPKRTDNKCYRTTEKGKHALSLICEHEGRSEYKAAEIAFMNELRRLSQVSSDPAFVRAAQEIL